MLEICESYDVGWSSALSKWPAGPGAPEKREVRGIVGRGEHRAQKSTAPKP